MTEVQTCQNDKFCQFKIGRQNGKDKDNNKRQKPTKTMTGRGKLMTIK